MIAFLQVVPTLQVPPGSDGLTRLLAWLLTVFAVGFLMILGFIGKAALKERAAPSSSGNSGGSRNPITDRELGEHSARIKRAEEDIKQLSGLFDRVGHVEGEVQRICERLEHIEEAT